MYCLSNAFVYACTTLNTARRWYNEATRDFIEWLKEFNGRKKSSDTPSVPIAMLGLDIYSLFTSADEVSQFENWL
jgi:erythromycin esterase-like protein